MQPGETLTGLFNFKIMKNKIILIITINFYCVVFLIAYLKSKYKNHGLDDKISDCMVHSGLLTIIIFSVIMLVDFVFSPKNADRYDLESFNFNIFFKTNTILIITVVLSFIDVVYRSI